VPEEAELAFQVEVVLVAQIDHHILKQEGVGRRPERFSRLPPAAVGVAEGALVGLQGPASARKMLGLYPKRLDA
jgi:hypothetical protein